MIQEIQTTLVMYDGQRSYDVDLAYYEGLRDRIEEILPALWPDQAYTTELLCGEEFWTPLSTYERQLVGRCVAEMVRKGELPLHRVGCKHERPARYRPK